MRVPEKIYLFENPITETPDDRWLTHRSGDDDIEYTRTDAFIKKALNYWKKLSYQQYPGAPMERIISDKELEDFYKAMKGE